MEYIVIKQVDNGWIIERNQYSTKQDRETVVCVNEQVVVQHIARMLSSAGVPL